MAIKIQLRRGTAAEWTSANPVLMQGEMGVETDTLKVKIGNGSTAWATLPYFTQGAKGDKGDQGIQGIQGVIGNTGPTGPVGPPNSLTVGTVTSGIEGSDAEVTITGTSPNQVMNLVIPRGDKGDAATIAVGTVTSVAAGQPVTVTNSGTSAAAVLNFEIPNAVGVPTGGSTGQIVRKTASATEWADNKLTDLKDVTLSSPATGQGLTYDGTKWVNATPVSALSGLSDVAVASPSDKQVLQYESSTGKWKNKQATGGVSVSDTTPASPFDGDALFYSADGTMFVRYNDGTSTQWVQPNAVLSSQIEQRYYSPNYIINGAFDFWQRGTSFSSSHNAYTADRWICYTNTNGASTFSRQSFATGESLAVGAEYYFRYARTTAGTGETYNNLLQWIEGVQSLAGKTTTISFWAKADAARTVNVLAEQQFGTGGSAVTQTSFGTVTLTTSWVRYSVTGVVPSVSGKTIGANNRLGIVLQLPFNTTFTVDVFGVQAEEGSTASPFRRNANSLQGELAACQRYYFRSPSATGGTYGTLGTGLAANSTEAYIHLAHPVTMRVPPTSIEVSNLLLWNGAATPTIFTMTLYSTQTTSNMTCVRITSNSLASQTIYFVIQGNNSAGYWAASAEL